jgi:hypothetical protein
MPVEFFNVRDEYGLYKAMRIHSPTGGMFTVSPFEEFKGSMSHQTKGKARGFGASLTSGKSKRTMQIGTIGDTKNFLDEIDRELRANPWFWKQM